MSKENNYEELAYDTVKLEIDLGDTDYHADDFRIEVASREKLCLRSLLSDRFYILRGVKSMKKAIITVVGKDTVGIIAKVCTYLADNQINILDISQTIVSGIF